MARLEGRGMGVESTVGADVRVPRHEEYGLRLADDGACSGMQHVDERVLVVHVCPDVGEGTREHQTKR